MMDRVLKISGLAASLALLWGVTAQPLQALAQQAQSQQRQASRPQAGPAAKEKPSPFGAMTGARLKK